MTEVGPMLDSTWGAETTLKHVEVTRTASAVEDSV